MSIRKKLYIGFGTIILFLLISSSIAYYQMNKINKQYSLLIEDRVFKLIEVNNLLNASSLEANYIRSYIIEPSDTAIKNLEDQEKIINKKIEELDKLFTSQTTRDQLQIIKTNQAIFEEAANEIIISYNKKIDSQAIIDIMRKKGRPAGEAIQQAVQEIVIYQTEQVDKVKAESSKTAQVSSIIIIIFAIVSTIFALLIALLITRSITIPVNKLAAAAKVIANGDLRQEDVEVKTKDAIGNLAASFNLMKSNLHSLINNVSTNVEHTTSLAEELAAGTDEVSLSSNNIAKRIEITADSVSQAATTGRDCSIAMDETAFGVQRIAEATQALHTKAADTQSIANDGGEMLNTTENQMMIIQQSSHETNERIKQFSAQSAEIENISKVITNISDQTNLLALNAAIEAARAGEHGQGFAVVADEVRKLAEESKKSANQIVGLTTLIQQDTKEVEKAVSVTVQNIDEGVAYVKNAQSAFTDIMKAIEDMASQIEDVTASTQQISASTEEVSASINEMSSTANNAAEQSELIAATIEEQTATIHEISVVAKSLSEDATALQKKISKFDV
ncbi:methyl-accepting chemotaxis protein [Lysinibacillus sp. NPDC094177]|uniref:methyl-accepting chemotaxis protein n=1 Tax=Lysinibacillus sp. NPDC094177 TaxID=3390580 RepID=UPI003D08BAB9